MNRKDDRLTVRLRAGEFRTIRELSEAMNVSNSMLVRTIITDFLTRNEETLERLIEDKIQERRKKDADN